jgi:hypothetical protein
MMTERIAEEWGRLAVSLPGWRWMPGMLEQRTSERYEDGDGPWVVHKWPDPDDPATAGCLLALLGSGCRVWQDREDGLWTVEIGGVRASMHATLGRACIATAAALGRWPNVAECGQKEVAE